MANFKEAVQKMLTKEGGYSFHPADRGGETYKGISRTHHPTWPGWKIIDDIKRATGSFGSLLEQELSNSLVLQGKIEAFYKAKYWDKIRGAKIHDQQTADKVFDIAVNMGVGRSIRFLQESLNLLNRDNADYADIDVDGILGPVTLGALASFLKLEKSDPKYLLKMLSLLQGKQYIEIMRNAPEQEVFARGWLNRI